MRLKELRGAARLTQREAASRLFLPVRTYQNYERGVNSPDVETLSRLADLFDTTVDDLIGRTNPVPRELRDAWDALDEEGREELLALARTLAEGHETA